MEDLTFELADLPRPPSDAKVRALSKDTSYLTFHSSCHSCFTLSCQIL